MRVFPFPIIVKVGKNLPCVVVVIVCLKRMIKFRTGIERLFGGAPRMHPTQFKEDVMIDDLFVYQREKIVYCRSFFTANLKNPVFFHLFSFHVPYGTSCGTGERFMGQGTVNACEGYKMATSKFLPSLVHFGPMCSPVFRLCSTGLGFCSLFQGLTPSFFALTVPCLTPWRRDSFAVFFAGQGTDPCVQQSYCFHLHIFRAKAIFFNLFFKREIHFHKAP